MTKEQFENYKSKTTFCSNCNRELNNKYFSYRRIKRDGVGICKTCDWIQNHSPLPEFDNFTNDDIFLIVDIIINSESTLLNDVACYLNKDLDDIISIVKNLKIGNKSYSIKVKCKNCGNDVFVTPSVYLKNENIYCSNECYWKHKSEIILKGKDSPFYNRIDTVCTYCNKPISVTPYQYEEKNMFGDNHNFCSKHCYWEYRSKYYVGDKHFKYEMTPEIKEKIRTKKNNSQKNINRLDTNIQLIVNSILDKNNIKYTREYITKYYAIDNYLDDYKLMIEVMGDYWHANPNKYNENKYWINQKQYDGIHRDKIKHSFVKNQYNIEILYLWEQDILACPQLCEKLILKYIISKGILDNYHSFNYSLIDNEIKLNSKLTIPYQDMLCQNYKSLLKQKIS